jgi:hypothetical protein
MTDRATGAAGSEGRPAASHDLTPMQERRRAPRLRTLLGGRLVFDDGVSTMDCTVRNLSAWGARIVLADAFRLPRSFRLVVPHHHQTHRATIVWRKGDVAGVALSDV